MKTYTQRLIRLSVQMTARLRYFFIAHHRKGRGVHSPFAHDFIKTVLQDKTGYNAYSIAEGYRKSLLADKSRIAVTDFGAGSGFEHEPTRSVAGIARRAAVNRKYGRLLYRVAQRYKPELIVELGTSLGISTHYLALGNPGAKVLTIEADPVLAGLAYKGLSNDGITNVKMINETFEKVLPGWLPEAPGKTLVFIDGNHSRSATLKYAEFFLSKLQVGSLIVLDDINWSEGMRQAWREIRENINITLTVDLYRMGIVFLKRDFFKENYTIRF
jgi:predicted O-methyltransferase YrrM